MNQVQRLTIASSQLSNGQIALTSEQRHYLSRVLRLRQGDRFIAMNGRGQGWLAVLKADLYAAEILQPISAQTELPISVTLLIALPKNGMDDVVRQATELGVGRIFPILSDRTLLNPSSQKLERWQRIAQEAAEQCERQVVPELLAPRPWAEALQRSNGNDALCYLCEARGDRPHLLTCLNSALKSATPVVIAIGPEGGWTEPEAQAAIEAGYQAVSLGSRILRTATAPLVALSIVASVLEVMSTQWGND